MPALIARRLMNRITVATPESIVLEAWKNRKEKPNIILEKKGKESPKEGGKSSTPSYENYIAKMQSAPVRTINTGKKDEIVPLTLLIEPRASNWPHHETRFVQEGESFSIRPIPLYRDTRLWNSHL
ncbi:hypothetical protein Tco_1386798 [Tanacetum coccineum]